jgi:hypothetical protein
VEDPSKWIGHLLDNPERAFLQAGDTHFYRDDRLDPVALRQVFAIHQALEEFLNDSLSFYPYLRAHFPLDEIFSCIHGRIYALLQLIPDSVVLIRLDLPFYDPISQAVRTVLEQVTVEYFRSPWSMEWNIRVRAAPVDKHAIWYLSLPDGSNAKSEYNEPPPRCVEDNLADFSGNVFPAHTVNSEQAPVPEYDPGMDLSSLLSTSPEFDNRISATKNIESVPFPTSSASTGHAIQSPAASIVPDRTSSVQMVTPTPPVDPGITVNSSTSFAGEADKEILEHITEHDHDARRHSNIQTTNTLGSHSLPHILGLIAPTPSSSNAPSLCDTQSAQTAAISRPVTICAAPDPQSLSVIPDHPPNNHSQSLKATNNDDEGDSSSSAISDIEIDEPPIPKSNGHQPATNHGLTGATNSSHVRTFHCRVCNRKPFKSKWNLDKHMDTHNGVTYTCTICGETYSRAHDRRRHILRKHNGELWKCNYCPKTLARKPTPGKPHRCLAGTGQPPSYVKVRPDDLTVANP